MKNDSDNSDAAAVYPTRIPGGRFTILSCIMAEIKLTMQLINTGKTKKKQMISYLICC
jgi:hypothetical protein